MIRQTVMTLFLLAPAAALAQMQSSTPQPAASPAPATKTAGSDADKMRCKSHFETGSMVRKIRECHTNAEWQRMAEDGRNDAATYQQTMGGAGNGG